MTDDGWRTTKRALKRRAAAAAAGEPEALRLCPELCAPTHRERAPIDFTIENPGGGKLFYQPCVRELYDDHWAQPWGPSTREAIKARLRPAVMRGGRHPCARLLTSYCKYGAPYQKDTGICTSLAGLRLAPPCAEGARCAHGGRHPEAIDEAMPKDRRNHVPAPLVEALLGAFVAKQRACGRNIFLLVDAFAGWQSVADAARALAAQVGFLRQGEVLLCATNDIVQRREAPPTNTNFDMSGPRLLGLLVRNALLLHRERIELARAEGRCMRALYDAGPERAELPAALARAGAGVLLHCSFPCTTYSTAGGATHRERSEIAPKSAVASAHDEMLRGVVSELVELCELRHRGPPA